MKRAKKFLLLAAVLAVVAGGYAVLSNFTKDTASEDAASKKEASIPVAAVDSTSVSELTWTYSGETVTLKHQSGGWSYAEDANFPLDQTKVDSMLKALTAVTATRSIDDAADMSEYGLDKPGCTITVLFSDGSEKKLSIGNKNEVTNGYYLRVGDESKVYMVDDSLESSFSNTLMDMVATEKIPYFQTVNDVTIRTPESTQKLIYKDSAGDITYTDAYKWFYEVNTGSSTGYTPLSTDKVTELNDSFSGLSWKRCADYFASPDDLKAFGLRDPKLDVTVDYSVYDSENGTQFGTFELLIGDKTGEEYYAKLKDSNIVYLIDASFVEKLLAANYESLRPDDVCLMDWKTVDSLDATVDGKTVTINFGRSGSTASSGNGANSDSSADSGSGNTVTYKINGADADSAKVEAFLNSITGMDAANKADNASSSALAEVTIVFHRNTDYYKTMTFKLSKYDSAYYLVDFAGQTRLLVTKSTVTSLKEAFAALAQ